MSFGRTPSIAKAEAPRLRALEIRKEITAKYPGEAAKRALLVSNVNLTELYGMSNRADKARPYAEGAVTIAEELSQANPNDPDSQNALSSSLNNLGGVYALLEDLPASEKACRRALDVPRETGARASRAGRLPTWRPATSIWVNWDSGWGNRRNPFSCCRRRRKG